MKSLLLLLITLAISRGQETALCQCAAFVNVEEGQIDVLDFPSFTVSSCTATIACSGFCAGEWTLWTNDGNLDFEMPDGITVGQHMCTNAAANGYTDITQQEAYLSWNICEGPWRFEGQYSQEPLCCQGGTYTPC